MSSPGMEYRSCSQSLRTSPVQTPEKRPMPGKEERDRTKGLFPRTFMRALQMATITGMNTEPKTKAKEKRGLNILWWPPIYVFQLIYACSQRKAVFLFFLNKLNKYSGDHASAVWIWMSYIALALLKDKTWITIFSICQDITFFVKFVNTVLLEQMSSIKWPLFPFLLLFPYCVTQREITKWKNWFCALNLHFFK